MADANIKDMRADAMEAFDNSRLYRKELEEIYRYFMPFRQSTSEQSPQTSSKPEGQSRTNHLFDGTGLSAAFSFAGNMQADWMPPFEEFFKLEAGPLIPVDERPEINRELERITEMVHAMLGRIRITAHESFYDLFGGTGAMFINGADDHPNGDLIVGGAVPPMELAIQEGAWGDIWRVWWGKAYKAMALEETWPDGKFSDAVARALKENKRAPIEVMQFTRYDRKERRWKLSCWTDRDTDTDAPFHTEEFRVSPWSITRFFKVPGEQFGRGLAHLGLPFVKTTNKTRELALRAAAFAIMGLWMRRNDGVFNPDTARFQPLAMWTVASTGGPLGASIQRLPVPQDFDVSSIVIEDERSQARRVLLDDELPPENDPVRSATEVAGRLQRYARNKGGTGSRIALELIAATVRRSVDILEHKGVLDTNLKIDQLLTQVLVTAPAAAAQRADKVARVTNWIQILVMLVGPQAALLFSKFDELAPEMGRWLGVDERFIPTKDEIAELKQLVAEMIAKMQGGEKAEAQQPPSPQAQFVNGGAI